MEVKISGSDSKACCIYFVSTSFHSQEIEVLGAGGLSGLSGLSGCLWRKITWIES